MASNQFATVDELNEATRILPNASSIRVGQGEHYRVSVRDQADHLALRGLRDVSMRTLTFTNKRYLDEARNIYYNKWVFEGTIIC